MLRVEADGVELKAQLWSVWKPRAFRAARLRWDEIHQVTLCEIENFLMPGGVDENFILVTTQGEFTVSTRLWGPQARQIAQLVAQRIGQPIHVPTPAPADPRQAMAQLAPDDRLGVKLTRAFGWFICILDGLFIALLSLALWAGQPGERLALAKVIFIALLVFVAASHLRNFTVRKG